MRESSPSMQEWKDLYSVAVGFKEIGSWDWMLDSDVFGVQDPATGEIGYCCVMGRLGEMFALAVYLGTEGLKGYLKIQSGEVGPGDMELFTLQKCLMASFEDRRSLKKRDLEVIRKLGLKFRGRNEWPMFRSYRPGYFSWYLTKVEAGYLTLALEQAIEVSLRFEEDPDMLTPRKRNHYFVRVPEKEGDGWKWRDEWLRPSPVEKMETVAEPIDEIRLRRIKKRLYRQQGVWEADFFYFPSAVEEGEERPYYPYVFLWVDHRSGLILGTHMTKPSEYRSEFSGQFLDLVENLEFLPDEVLVRREEAFRLLEPITSELDIRLRHVRRLKALEQAQDSMFQFFA